MRVKTNEVKVGKDLNDKVKEFLDKVLSKLKEC